ncbi:MAG TPA: cupin domain-containing protein [Pseudonocardia sp.]
MPAADPAGHPEAGHPAVRHHDLRRHPEGGWYRRTWTAPDEVRTADGRVRPAATLILFCLPPGECSAWHRVASDEVWIWNGAGRITLRLGGAGERPSAGEDLVLGPDPAAGEMLQARVPAGTWQRTLPADTLAMASCLVSPGFDFADFTLAGD